MIILWVIIYLYVGLNIGILRRDPEEIVLWFPHLFIYCLNIGIEKL